MHSAGACVVRETASSMVLCHRHQYLLPYLCTVTCTVSKTRATDKAGDEHKLVLKGKSLWYSYACKILTLKSIYS